MNLSNGTRVLVRIADRERFAKGAAESLDGMRGEVVGYNPESINGSTWLGPAYLVRLDRKPRKWSSYQLPGRGWWFAPEDLDPEGPRRVEFDEMALEITPARYAKGKMLARVVDKPEHLRGLKSRAEYLMGVKGAGARYTNREGGYVMSPAAVDRLVCRLHEGYDATILGELLPPSPGPAELCGGVS